MACETIFQALAPSRPIARGVRSAKPPSSRRVPTNVDAAQKVRVALDQALATPEVREKLEANGGGRRAEHPPRSLRRACARRSR